MSETFFAADTHFGHRNLVEGWGEGVRGPRGRFASIEEHDETIIDNWNAVVGHDDKVYLLGDVAMSVNGLKKVARLKGQKRLIMGNHDLQHKKTYGSLFVKIYGAKCLEGMILTHIPIHESCLNRRSMQVNVHGHTHDRRITSALKADDQRYTCVSMEQINYKPIHIDTLKWHFNDALGLNL